MTVLSVNLNKIALLRNSRGEARPSVVDAARVAIASGAAGITLHPRPDQRHALARDVADIAALLAHEAPSLELNLEGNPFALANGRGYPGFVALVERARAAQATLVPDADAQLTSDHGFDPPRDAARLAPIVARLKDAGARVSVFVDHDARGLEALASIGVDRVELYTGPFAKAFARGDADAAAPYARCAEAARAAGLGVNAGHDLDQSNVGALLQCISWIDEVSIGHALIADALDVGLAETVRRYVALLSAADR